MRKFRVQLVDQVTGAAITTAGGKAYVAINGDAAKATLYTAAGAALTNPVTPTNGIIEFYTADAVSIVDLYVQSPTGHFVVVKNVIASGPNSIFINRGLVESLMVIPFAAADQTAATETNTGFSVPTNGMVLPGGMGLEVLTVDATETIDVGTLSSASGDADGFIVGASVATAGVVKASLANGAVTLGALLKVQDSANVGDAVPEASTASAGKAITYTLSAGSDTAEGFLKIPVQLAIASL